MDWRAQKRRFRQTQAVTRATGKLETEQIQAASRFYKTIQKEAPQVLPGIFALHMTQVHAFMYWRDHLLPAGNEHVWTCEMFLTVNMVQHRASCRLAS